MHLVVVPPAGIPSKMNVGTGWVKSKLAIPLHPKVGGDA